MLWQRNALQRVRIASLTKMMTALLTVQSTPPSERVLVTQARGRHAGSKVGVLPLGKHVRLETMLYGLLLPSGNDAAMALAQHVSGSVSAFVRRMNAEAARLGMGCTRYSSPSGFYDHGQLLLRGGPRDARARRPRAAADRAGRAHATRPRCRFPIKGGKLYLYNNNPLLIYHYPGTTGLKTGFTDRRRPLPGRDRRARRRAPRRRRAPLARDPGRQARQLLDRGFERRLPPAAGAEPEFPPGA